MRRALQPRQHLVGERLQGIAGEDRRRLAVSLVAGGTAAAQVIVIERRQVVMDQRIGVDHLQGRADFLHAHRQCAADGRHARALHAQDGTDTLTAGKDAVAHRAVDGDGIRIVAGKQALQGLVNGAAAGLECLFQHRGWD